MVDGGRIARSVFPLHHSQVDGSKGRLVIGDEIAGLAIRVRVRRWL